MAKPKKKKLKSHTGNDLHIEWEERLDQENVTKRYLTLSSITPITIFGEPIPFQWEGTYNNEIIKISLPRQTSEHSVKIPNNFPNKLDPDRGSTANQLYDELKRVLRQLN